MKTSQHNKHTVPSAAEVQAQGQIELDFTDQLDPNDPDLPLPRGLGCLRARRINVAEVVKLNAVRDAGGLVPDNGERIVWRCAVCHKIYPTEGQAYHCCRAEPELVTICVRCHQAPSKCRCSERRH